MATRAWQRAAATAGTARVPVVLVGSSSTAGSNATAPTRRFVDLTAAMLRGRHNAAGVPGGIGVTAANTGLGNGWTRSGGANILNRGLAFNSYQLAPTNWIDRPWVGTAITVLYEQGPGAGQFTVAVDGGAAVTVTPNVAAGVNTGTYTTPVVAAGSHSVRITGVGTVVIESVYEHNGDTAAGVQVWNGGYPGVTSADLANVPGMITRLGVMAPALIVLMITANDYAAGTNPATSKTRIQTWLASLFAGVSPAPSVLLVHSYRRLDVLTPAFPWASYGTILQEIAAADPDRIGYLDASGLYPASQAADTWDLIDADDIHQTDRGHMTMADALADALAMDLTYDAVLSRVRISAAVGPDNATASVERSADQVRWTTVRGGVAAPVVGGVVSLDDYEFGTAGATYYRVRAGTAVTDSFTRTVASSWGTAPSGQAWTTAGGSAGDYAVTGSVGTHSAGAVASSRRTLVGASRYDADVTVTVSTSALAVGASQHATVMHRHVDVDNMIMLQARLNTSQTVEARIVARVASVESEVVAAATVAGLTHQAGVGLRIRAQVIGTLRRIKIWSAAGVEPPIWHNSAISSAVTAPGQVGARSFLFTGNTNVLPVTFSWDDYVSPIVQRLGNITPVLDRVWLKSISRPFLNQQISLGGKDFTVDRPARGSLHDVVGRSLPVAVTDVRGSRRYPLTIRTTTAAAAANLDYILASGDVLYLHAPAGKVVPAGGVYVRVEGTQEHRLGVADELRQWTVPVVEVAAPGPDVIGRAGTCQTVLNAYATCADVLAAFATCADLLTQIAPPSEVIVS